MPEGYFYVNESTLWQPIMVAYALLISGAVLLIMAVYSYFTGRLRKLTPLSLLTGASMFIVVLLGPLGDLMSPQKPIEIMINPHILPSDAHPGVSLIGLFGGLLWPLGFIFTVIFGLLYFSYPLYLKAEEGGKLRPLLRILSLGVSSAEKYEKLKPITKGVGIILVIVLIPWLFYPGLLFLIQTNTFIWANWHLLPIQNLIENFLLALSLLLFVYCLHFYDKKDEEVITELNRLIASAALFFIIVVGMQAVIWGLRFGGSPFYPQIQVVYPLMTTSIILALITIFFALFAAKTKKFSIITGILGMLAIFVSKWNTIMVGQTTSKTGLAILELEMHGIWFLNFFAPIAAGIVLYIILTFIFPVEVETE